MRLKTPYKIYPSGARNNFLKYRGHLSIHLILSDIPTLPYEPRRPQWDSQSTSTPAQHNYTKVGWVNEPDGRGTLSILVSCLSSLFLSSWAVMHLNVPRRRCSTTRRLATYFYWCIYGIFGPELVIWTAWRQLLSAWALRNELREVRTGMSCTDRAVADSS